MKRSERHWVGKLRELAAGATEYDTVIDLSVGEPDGPPPEVVESFLADVLEPLNAYPDALGRPSLREALSEWIRDRLGIDFGPDELIVTHGAKLAIALAPIAFTSADDVIVAPTPGYPTYANALAQLEREMRWLRLRPENRYEPTRADLECAFEGAKMAFLSYPSNPTGLAGSDRVFEDAVAVARSTRTLLIHDAAYAELTHDGARRSVFNVPGADEVALEIHSLSKSMHLCGYRVGFVVGRRPLLSEYARVMALYDTGATRLSQRVAEVAIRGAPSFADQRHERDGRRTAAMATLLERLGCQVQPPDAAFYVWFRPPQRALEAGLGWQALVKRAGIACAPGEAFGPAGRDWVRFACVRDDSVSPEVAERLQALWG